MLDLIAMVVDLDLLLLEGTTLEEPSTGRQRTRVLNVTNIIIDLGLVRWNVTTSLDPVQWKGIITLEEDIIDLDPVPWIEVMRETINTEVSATRKSRDDMLKHVSVNAVFNINK